MEIKIFESGSKGNLYYCSDGDTNFLIEAGVSIKKIKKYLDYKLNEIDFVLLSHMHGDHSKSIQDIMMSGIDCCMSKETSYQLSLLGHRLHTLYPMTMASVGTFKILPFETQHDCAGAIGFLVQSIKTGEKLIFATDTSYLKYKFTGVDYYMIECNYSLSILDDNVKKGIVAPALRDRVIQSHFGLDNVIEFFKANDLSRCKAIYLLHLSDANSDAELFKSEIQKVTGKPVYVGG